MSPGQQGRGGAGGKGVSAPGRALSPHQLSRSQLALPGKLRDRRSWIPKRPESFKRMELSPSSVDKE